MADRAHLSIGEVLSLLQDEFPDVTISKIRFLESQGLLDPERTPSGYRKFYEDDIERLRWILTQQRENFLPLKVIKDRLDEAQRAGAVVPDDRPLDPEPARARTAAALPGLEAPVREPAGSPAPEETVPAAPAPAPAAAPGAPELAAGVAETSAPTAAPVPPTDGGGGTRAGAPPVHRSNPLDGGVSGVSLTSEELGEASGLSPRELDDLVRFGLLQGRSVGADVFYDGDALVVARTAAGFLRHGVEARHLRMYKVSAEREAGFYEQVVMPLLKQRNPESRRQAVETLGDLARLGEQLRSALLRAGLREHTG